MGRLREVCGSVSGMFLAAGYIYGYDDPKDYEAKKEHYARIQELAEAFSLADLSDSRRISLFQYAVFDKFKNLLLFIS